MVTCMGRGKSGERLRARHRWDRFVAPSGRDGVQEQGLFGEVLLSAEPAAKGDAGEEVLGVAVEDDAAEDAVGEDHGISRAGGARWVLSAGLAAVVLCVLGLVAGLWWWSAASSKPDVSPVEPRDSTRSTAGEGAGGGGSRGSGEESTGGPGADGGRVVVVHVAGAVAKPGVYRLPEGSRIHDAISAAGGALPFGEPDRLNLAAQVEDGARIAVPRQGEGIEPSTGSASNAEAGRSTGGPSKVNLNTASAQELAQLPRVGPVLAQRIVDYRAQHGRFSSPQDLDAVPGIGQKMLESLLPLVSV